MSETFWTGKRVNATIASLLLLLFTGLQAWFSNVHERQWTAQFSLGPAPGHQWLTLASLGEQSGMGRGLALYTQSFDIQAGKAMSIARLDLKATRDWLATAGELAPTSAYPGFLASRIYASVASPTQSRLLLDWVAGHYSKSPATQWPWLAHAVYLAKHVLGDTKLALEYAHQLRVGAGDAPVPQWARDLEVFLLLDLNELEAARTLLGGLIASGQIRDQRALQVMIADLERIGGRFQPDQRPRPGPGNAELKPKPE